jgi:hypothetical protein
MNKIKIVLDKQITIFNANFEIIKRLKNELSFSNPAYTEAKKRGRWTGNIDKILHFSRMIGGF